MNYYLLSHTNNMTLSSKPEIKNYNYWWIIVWFISLFCIYEVEIRSLGHYKNFERIDLLPGFWLSDFGLVFPIVVAILLGGLTSFLRIRVVIYFLLSFVYGIVLFLLHNNSFAGLGLDLRICISLFTGLSLVWIMPEDYKKILSVINLISFIFVITTILHLLAIPDLKLQFNERVVTESANTFIGMPLVLIAPIIIISTFTGDRLHLTISFATILIMIILSLMVTKTRSLVTAEIVAFSIAIRSIVYSAKLIKRIKISKNLIKYLVSLIIIISLALTAIIFSQEGNAKVFMERFSTSGDDITSLWRQMEVLSVLQTMSITDLVIGMGFNPPSPLITLEERESYNIIHIGILNVWWRFGFIVFMGWIVLFIRLVIKWNSSLRSLTKSIHSIKGNQQKIAVIMCAPGIFTVVFVSFLSGGWGLHTFLSCGILLGFYNEIIRDKKLTLNMTSHPSHNMKKMYALSKSE